MSGGRKKVAPQAKHQPAAQDAPSVPGRNVDGLNTKIGRAREKAARKAAKKAARERAAGQADA